jgi:hypothetical protein
VPAHFPIHADVNPEFALESGRLNADVHGVSFRQLQNKPREARVGTIFRPWGFRGEPPGCDQGIQPAPLGRHGAFYSGWRGVASRPIVGASTALPAARRLITACPAMRPSMAPGTF